MDRNAATGVMALTLALAACGSGADPVSGVVDSKKYRPAKVEWVNKPAYRQKCETKTRTTNGKTRTESHQSCKQVRAGTKRVRETTRQAQYRIEVEDRNDNDTWYCATSSDYHKATEGKKIKFVPTGHC